MSEAQAVARRRRRIRRKRRRADDREEMQPDGAGLSGLANLQQRVGNRAVQRMLLQREREEGTAPSDLEQEPETIPEKTGERVKVPSGAGWVEKFSVSKELSDLDSDMQSKWKRFTTVLEAASANVEVIATKVPPERAYLMHWAWQIAKENIDPRRVPDADPQELGMKDPVDIQWWHGDLKASQAAAQGMIDGYKINDLKTSPPLPSPENLYTEGKALVAIMDWRKELTLYRYRANEEVITDEPRDATNPAVIAVAETYDLVHLFSDPDTHEVHWGAEEQKEE